MQMQILSFPTTANKYILSPNQSEQFLVVIVKDRMHIAVSFINTLISLGDGRWWR